MDTQPQQLAKTPGSPEVTGDQQRGLTRRPWRTGCSPPPTSGPHPGRPTSSSLRNRGSSLTAQLASPPLTTLLALAEPLVSFFIPLIFIPSADTNIWFQSEASSDSEETRHELCTQTGSAVGFLTESFVHHGLLLLFLTLLIQQRAEGVPDGDKLGFSESGRGRERPARASGPSPTSGYWLTVATET